MITASADFITEVTKLSRNFRARILLDGSALDCDIKSIHIHKGSGTEVVPGSVYVPYIDAELMNCSTALKGEDITLEISVRTGPDEYDPITIGTYYDIKAKGDTSSLHITAVGMLAKAFQEKYISGLTYPASINDILDEISDGTNVDVSLKGLNGEVAFPRAIAGRTCLEALSIIAGVLGGFVTEDNAGGVVIAAYGSGETLSVNGDRSATAPEVHDSDYVVTGIKCIVKDGDGETAGESYQYGVVNVEYHNAYMTQELFDVVCENIVGYTFRPGTVPLTIGDPRLEAWDTLEVEDLSGNTFDVPCIAVEHYFDGGVTTSIDAEVTVEEEADAMMRGPVTIAVEAATQAAADALETAESILIYDHGYEYNPDTGIASFEAYLYRGGVDVKLDTDEEGNPLFPPDLFTWYLKTEDGEEPILNAQGNNYGYTCEVNTADCGYGAEVVGYFSISDDAIALAENGDTLENSAGTPYTVRATGETVRVRDLTVTTTLYGIDKLMVIGAENEHLVTVQTLADAVDKHYVHTQSVVADTWNINHNLNKFPSISVVDSAESQVEGDVEYVDANNVTLRFCGAFSGKAYLN